jgi:crotonobetainyl-CoA:carnitine CoA-transferase CaiB-like acyl-CoA transferase
VENDDEWDALCDALGRLDLAEDYKTAESRKAVRAHLDEVILAWDEGGPRHAMSQPRTAVGFVPDPQHVADPGDAPVEALGPTFDAGTVVRR